MIIVKVLTQNCHSRKCVYKCFTRYLLFIAFFLNSCTRSFTLSDSMDGETPGTKKKKFDESTRTLCRGRYEKYHIIQLHSPLLPKIEAVALLYFTWHSRIHACGDALVHQACCRMIFKMGVLRLPLNFVVQSV